MEESWEQKDLVLILWLSYSARKGKPQGSHPYCWKVLNISQQVVSPLQEWLYLCISSLIPRVFSYQLSGSLVQVRGMKSHPPWLTTFCSPVRKFHNLVLSAFSWAVKKCDPNSWRAWIACPSSPCASATVAGFLFREQKGSEFLIYRHACLWFRILYPRSELQTNNLFYNSYQLAEVSQKLALKWSLGSFLSLLHCFWIPGTKLSSVLRTKHLILWGYTSVSGHLHIFLELEP